MARAAAPILRGLRGRTSTTTSSPSLEGSTKTAQFYDNQFCFASFAKCQHEQDECRNYGRLPVLARRIVK